MSKPLPRFFKTVFWSYDFSSIDTEKDKRRIIINTVNYGEWRHWQWLFENYGGGQIKETVENTPQTEFRPGALKLISVLLSIKKLKYASRSAYIRKKKLTRKNWKYLLKRKLKE